MGEQGESFRQAVNHAKQLHDDKGYDWRQSGLSSAEVAASGGFSIGGFGATASVKGIVSAENSSGQSVGESTKISRDNNAEQNKSNIEKAMANSTWAKENSIDTGYSDSVRESYEEVQRAEQQASISKQRVDDWHQAKTVVDSQGASSSKDMYQEVADGAKREYGVDAKTAQRMADTRSPEAQRVWKKLQNDDNYVQSIVANIGHSREGVSGEAATQKLDQFTNENSKTINQDTGSNIRQHAANQGMNVDNFKDNIQDAGKNLKEQHKEITSENATQYKAVKDNNEIEESRTQQQVDKYEKNRLGKDVGLGAPDKDVKSMIIDKGIYEHAKNNNDKNE